MKTTQMLKFVLWTRELIIDEQVDVILLIYKRLAPTLDFTCATLW